MNTRRNSSGLNWDLVWNEVNSANINCGAYGECASIWESKEQAESFLKSSEDNPARLNYILGELPLSPEFRVLDIGSGPGTVAVPVAGKVAHVTAVEPSPGMADVMEEYAARKGVSNLDIVRKRWEDLDPFTELSGPYDIVIASYSLGMQDLREAVRKMCAVSSGRVYIFWISGMPDWERGMVKLWPELHGRDFCCTPQADIIYNVLYSMGIYPDMKVRRIESRSGFSDMDVMLSHYSRICNVQTERQKEILKSYLEEISDIKRDCCEISGTNMSTVFWWDVTQYGDNLYDGEYR